MKNWRWSKGLKKRLQTNKLDKPGAMPGFKITFLVGKLFKGAEKMFIQTKVFDPTLEGQAIALSGSLIEGNFIVSKVNFFSIVVVGLMQAAQEIPMSDFEHGAVEMVVLQHPRQNIVDVEAQEIKEPITRHVESRQHRTTKQVNKENAEIERMLQENIEPMKLEDILRRMRQLGYANWSNNNASGFVKRAIKCGMPIIKIKTGVYSYDWGGPSLEQIKGGQN